MRTMIFLFCGGFFLSIICFFIGDIIYQNSIDYVSAYNNTFGLAVFRNGKVALVDSSGNTISKKMDYISPFSYSGCDSLAIFVKNHKSGYLSIKTGHIIFHCNHAWKFDRETGLAAFCLKNKVGFINRFFKIVIQPQYVYFHNTELNGNRGYEEEFYFEKGVAIVPAGVKYGLINTCNELLLPCIYDFISPEYKGYRVIKSDGKSGLYEEKSNKILISVHFQEISLNDQGIIFTDTLKNNGHVKYLATYDFKTQVPLFDELIKLSDEYGMPCGFSKYIIGEKAGLWDDKNKKRACAAQFEDIAFYQSPLTFKATLPGGNVVIIDERGYFINQTHLK